MTTKRNSLWLPSRLYAKNPSLQRPATQALNRAVAKGIIKRPDKCSACGQRCKPDGHHVDYAKPYNVEWLCRTCHFSLHSNRTGNSDFADSVRLLIEREEYSQTDIGMMFGVSRERVRQWCKVLGIKLKTKGRGLKSVRVWDDFQNCFKPFPKRVVKKMARNRQNEIKKLHQDQQKHERRVWLSSQVCDLNSKLGRAPTILEILARIKKHTSGKYPLKHCQGARVANYWGIPKGVDYKAIVAEIYVSAGLSPRGRGGGSADRLHR
jgi:hypothetical protein